MDDFNLAWNINIDDELRISEFNVLNNIGP